MSALPWFSAHMAKRLMHAHLLFHLHPKDNKETCYLLRGHESQLEEQAEIMKAKYRKYTGCKQALCNIENMYILWGRNLCSSRIPRMVVHIKRMQN